MTQSIVRFLFLFVNDQATRGLLLCLTVRVVVGCGVSTHSTAHWKPVVDFYSGLIDVAFELLRIQCHLSLDCCVVDNLVRHFPVLRFQVLHFQLPVYCGLSRLTDLVERIDLASATLSQLVVDSAEFRLS